MAHDFRLFYCLITYGVCKKRKYCNRMSEKKNSPFDECSCFVYVKRQKEQKNFRLSVCMSGCTYVRDVKRQKEQKKFPSVCLCVCLDVRTYVDFSCGHNNFRRS